MLINEYMQFELLSMHRTVSSIYIKLTMYQFIEYNAEQKWWYCKGIQRLDDSLYDTSNEWQIRMVLIKKYMQLKIIVYTSHSIKYIYQTHDVSIYRV